MKNYNSGSLPGIVSILTKIRIAVSQDYAPPVDDLIRAQIVPYIIQLLKPTLFKEEDLITEALWIVANIASRESDHVNYLMGNDIVQKVLPLLEHPNFHVQENVIWILSNICGESLVYRDQVLKYGIADKIDKFLGKFEGPESIIVCMAWFISNLCRGEPYPAFNDVRP